MATLAARSAAAGPSSLAAKWAGLWRAQQPATAETVRSIVTAVPQCSSRRLREKATSSLACRRRTGGCADLIPRSPCIKAWNQPPASRFLSTLSPSRAQASAPSPSRHYWSVGLSGCGSRGLASVLATTPNIIPRLSHRFASTTADGPAAPPHAATPPPPLTRPIVAYHLFVLAFLVYAIVVVGGLTRLTESGLSITEWNPGFKGMWLPTSEQDWLVEWDKYKKTPEFILLNHSMTLNDFRTIYAWEWAHRILGRLIGVAFVLPAGYFLLRRGYVAPGTRWKLVAIAAGIGFQGALGWFMVKSGLAAPEETGAPHLAASHPSSTTADPRAEGSTSPSTSAWTPRVSHFRLTAHLGTAFLVYAGMVHTGLAILRDWKLGLRTGSVGGTPLSALPSAAQSVERALSHPLVRRYARAVALVAAFVFTTAMTGGLVAGLDAGLVYNEFPTMGDGRIAPPLDELMDKRYARRPDDTLDTFWRNAMQNPVAVQLLHRTMAISSLLLVVALGVRGARLPGALARASSGAGVAAPAAVPRAGSLTLQLPRTIPRLAILSAGLVTMQATLGICTLIYLVPLPLASAHQAGSLAVLTSLIALLAALRKPRKAVSVWRDAVAGRALGKVRVAVPPSSAPVP